MKTKKRIASWGTRLAINFFTLVLTILFCWFLGFIVRDVQTLPPPDYNEAKESYFADYVKSEKATVDPREEAKALQQQIADTSRTISQKSHRQNLLRETSEDIARISNLLNSPERNEDAKELASVAWKEHLERRQQVVVLGDEIFDANAQKEELEAQKRIVDTLLGELERAASDHYYKLVKQHRLLVAFYLIAVLSPFFIVSLFLVLRCRKSTYFPIYLALGVATFLRIGFVMFEYFPSEYFKYILIGSLIAAVLFLLIYAIRSVARLTLDRVLKQNRESYERFLCTNCEYPIRTGPRTFLYWTRRTVHKVLPKPDASSGTVDDEVYSCPYCGIPLYETCPACGKVRHAQLEFCRHCGDKKEIELPVA